MSELEQLLSRCRELGAQFEPQSNGRLKVKAPAPLPAQLREQLKRRKAEVLLLLNSTETARNAYREMAIEVESDCALIDPHWLIERHPNLWNKMCRLDQVLTDLERESALGEDYHEFLSRLQTTVKEAAELYQSEQQAKPTQ